MTAPANAQSNSAPAIASTPIDMVPSQDVADDSAFEARTRVAQFPFFLFEQRPDPQPRTGTPRLREQRPTIYRGRNDEQTATRPPKTQKTVRRSNGEGVRDRIAAMLRNPPPVPPTSVPLLLNVSIAKQTVTLYDAGVPVAKGPVSSGTVERPTPMGIFSVLEKSWWHRSNMYSAAPMPFMQRITWSGVALHAGELPGYRASHGCVRLPESFALRLWYTTRIGARVVISWDEQPPVAIEHPALFQPLPQPSPQAPQSDQAVMSLNDAPVLPSQDDPADHASAGLTSATDGASPNAIADDPVLDHMMTAAVDDGEGLYDDPVAAAADLPLLPAKLEVDDVLRTKPADGVFALARRTATRRVAATSPPEPEIDRVLRPGPISVLVSRKDRRIYVRKGLQPIFAMPVSIASPEQDLGTHIYTAVGTTADGATLRWMAMSPSSHPVERSPRLHSVAAASAALNRVEIPQAASERIAQLISVGATLIITDQGLGRTASLLDSDFSVLLPEYEARSEERTEPRQEPARPSPRLFR